MKKLAPAVAIAFSAFAHLPANAWFFWIPTGQIQSAIEGNHCVAESAKEGDRIAVQGRQWIVKSTSGNSSRCTATPQWPIIAKLEPILSDAELRQVHTICSGQGVQVGSRTTIPGLGEVEVRSISSTGCSDTRAPVAANVVRLQSAFVLSALSRQPTPSQTPAPPAAQDDTACVPMGARTGDRITIKERGDVVVMSMVRRDEHCPSDRPWLARVHALPSSNNAVSSPPPVDPAVAPATAPRAPAPATKPVVERLRDLKKLREEDLISDAVYEQKQKEILREQ